MLLQLRRPLWALSRPLRTLQSLQRLPRASPTPFPDVPVSAEAPSGVTDFLLDTSVSTKVPSDSSPNAPVIAETSSGVVDSPPDARGIVEILPTPLQTLRSAQRPFPASLTLFQNVPVIAETSLGAADPSSDAPGIAESPPGVITPRPPLDAPTVIPRPLPDTPVVAPRSQPDTAVVTPRSLLDAPFVPPRPPPDVPTITPRPLPDAPVATPRPVPHSELLADYSFGPSGAGASSGDSVVVHDAVTLGTDALETDFLVNTSLPGHRILKW